MDKAERDSIIANKYKEEHNIDIKNILIRNKNKTYNSEKIDNLEERNKLKDKDINYDLWIKLNSDEKLKIFFDKILLENDNWYFLNEKIINNSYIEDPKIFSVFIDNYFKNKFKTNKIPKEWEKLFEEYIDYKEKTKDQLKKSIEKIWNLKNNNSTFLDFVENDVNSFHLIVAWTRFNFKQKKSENENIDIKKLNIPSLNYSEKILEDLSEKELVYLDNENNLQELIRLQEENDIIFIKDNFDKIKEKSKEIKKGLIKNTNNFFKKTNSAMKKINKKIMSM